MFSALNTYTQFHTLLSLVAILAGLLVVGGFLASKRSAWTQLFIWTTVATTLTGFGFPFTGFTPAIGTGIVSTLVLALLLVAFFAKKMQGGWRKVYVITAVISVYLNVFVLIVQLFLKVPALHALAPQGNEPPFAISQGIALVAFIAAGYASVKRFHPR